MTILRFGYVLSICLLVITTQLFASGVNNTQAMWPGTQYNKAIPTFKDVLGYDVGERIVNQSDMLRYFEALELAAPDRIKVQQYATSWQGKPLIYVVIGNTDNIRNLATIAAQTKQLADPNKTSDKQAAEMIANLPVSVWLQYAVHGNEISTTDAAMFTAYHLLAGDSDPRINTILDNALVFIDPLQNPDGRERFISRYYDSVGLEHSSDRLSAEHNEAWPSSRLNHYLFDMNRDWLAITQPETQGKIAAINQYLPQVVVDVHEMGGDMSYYFAPAAEPFNPLMTKSQIANMNAIGKNHAKHFDNFGFDYFTREIFDAFYPGYGDSWPAFYGASSSTYEVGSARGHYFTKSTGELLTFWDTVQRQFVASVSTAEGAALEREKILNDFYQYQSDAIKEAQKRKQRVFILPNERNRAGNHRLATLMAKHGIEVRQANENFKACGQQFKAGSYFIDSAQPRGRFVRTTFLTQIDMTDAFLKEQERRRERNLNDQIYDVTGWSLPMMFDVDVNTCQREVKASSKQVSQAQLLEGEVTNPEAKFGFVVAWGDMAAGRFLTAALQQGLTVKSVDEAFVLDDKKRYPAGSLVIEKRTNNDNLLASIEQIAQQTGAIVEGIDTSWVTEGPSFGSHRTVTMTAPKIAMAWGDSTNATSAGNTRFVIERQLGYPVTAIRSTTLGRADLSNYQVIVLPEGNYFNSLGQSGAKNLKAWVQKGGVLIALGNANRFTSDSEIGLLDVKREFAYREAKQDITAEGDRVPGQHFLNQSDLYQAVLESQTSPDHLSGVLTKVNVDQEHWLTAGVNKDLTFVTSGTDIYTPIKLNSGKNVVWFAGKDEILASGYLWQENKEQLAYKPVVVHQPSGKGMVIGYTQSPTYRAYLEGLNVLLANSLFRAPAHAQK